MEYKLSDDTWDQKEFTAIQKVLDNGYFSMGKQVSEYEKRFADKMGAKYAVMVNSGSSANLIIIAALIYSGRLHKGDEIIVPAVSWSTTYFPLSQFNLNLKFVDIDPFTLNIDLQQLELAISSKTKAIFCVNLLGNPNDYNQIYKLSKRYNLLVLEDNCESLGGKYEGKYLGTFGLCGSFSTFYSHHLCTMEGGIVITNDEELYHYMLCIRSHGWTRNLPSDSNIYQKKENDFYESYHFIMPGFNLRPLEIEAAIGIEQLKKMDLIIEQRRKNAKYFVEKMASLHNYRIQTEIQESSWFGFAIILTNDLKNKRDIVLGELQANQIEVRPIVAGNFTKCPAIRYLDYEIYGTLVNADEIHKNGFFVGNHCRDNHLLIDQLTTILGE